jgi:hypothetical protein
LTGVSGRDAIVLISLPRFAISPRTNASSGFQRARAELAPV